jgi:hypothetical protein
MRIRLYFYGALAIIVLGILVGMPTRWNLKIAVMAGALVGTTLILRRMRNLLGFAPHRPRLFVDESWGDSQDGCLSGRPHWADCHFSDRQARTAADKKRS